MKAHRHTGCFQKSFRDRVTGELKKSPQWWVKFSVNGKPQYENADTLKVSEAIAYRKRRIGETGNGQTVGADRITLDDLLKGVEIDYSNAELRSGRCLGYRSEHLREYFGKDCKAREVTTARLRAYRVHRKEQGASIATVNRELSVLRRGFKLATDQVGAIPVFPMIKENNARAGFFEPDQLKKIEAAFPEQYRRIWQMFDETGWRGFSEILSRKKTDVDLDGGWLTIDASDNKTKRARRFPITPRLREIIEAQLAWSRAVELKLERVIPWLFHTAPGMRMRNKNPGGRISRSRWDHAWIAAFKKAGVPAGTKVPGGRIPHDLRRTAAKRFVSAGVPQSVAMKLLGHETESIYRRYAIVDGPAMTEAAATLAAFRAAQAATAKPSKVEQIRNAG